MVSMFPWVIHVCQGFHRAQQKTLAALLEAFLASRSSILAQMARTLQKRAEERARPISFHAAAKRIDRFLANTRMSPSAVCRGLSWYVWPRLHAWKWIPILIDWTFNEKRQPWQTLAASIPIRGRGIPLLLWSFPRGDVHPHLTQPACERAFVEELLRLLPETERVVLVADRGFGGTDFLRWLDRKGIHYVIRLTSTVSVATARFQGPLATLPVQIGECYSLGPTLLRKQGSVGLRQLVVAMARPSRADKTPEPWFLATNLKLPAATITRIYARRMVIEQDFREAKSRLGWRDFRVRDPGHCQRFMLLLTLALAAATLVGLTASRRPSLLRQVTKKRKDSWEMGITALGIRLLAQSPHHIAFAQSAIPPASPW